MPNSISVLLVDDHVLLRRALRRTIEDEPDIHVVGEAGDGAEAVRLALQLRPQVVVMDLTMPVMDGIEATLQIRRQLQEVAILALSMHTESTMIEKAVSAGACGYLTKSATEFELTSAIRDVASGKRVLPVAGG